MISRAVLATAERASITGTTVFYSRLHGELQKDLPEAVHVVGGLLCRLQQHLSLGSAEPERHILEFLAFVVRKVGKRRLVGVSFGKHSWQRGPDLRAPASPCGGGAIVVDRHGCWGFRWIG
jgi:hypothetical protein